MYTRIALGILAVVLVSACINPAYTPTVSFTIDRSEITIKNNQTSTDLVTVTITKEDNKNIPTNFVVKFSYPDGIYPVINDQKVSEYTTKTLQYQDSKDPVQFKVFGQVFGQQDSATYTMIIQLYYNNSFLEGKEQTLKVIVNR